MRKIQWVATIIVWLCMVGSVWAQADEVGLMNLHPVSMQKSSLQRMVASKRATVSQGDKPIVVMADHPVIRVRLQSNRTTGFRWFLTSINRQLIQPVSAVFEPPRNRKLMGAPGIEVWTFKLKLTAFVVPTVAEIHLIYARPWDLQLHNAQEKVITVVTSSD